MSPRNKKHPPNVARILRNMHLTYTFTRGISDTFKEKYLDQVKDNSDPRG